MGSYLVAKNFQIAFGVGLLSFQLNAQSLHAFLISKEQNQNMVQYDARATANCTFDRDTPLEIYWLIFTGEAKYRREGLNFIEKGIYGADTFLENASELRGEIRALKSRRFDLRFRIVLKTESQRCFARTFLYGPKVPNEIELSHIELKDFSGPAPRELTIYGIASESGDPLSTTFRF